VPCPVHHWAAAAFSASGTGSCLANPMAGQSVDRQLFLDGAPFAVAAVAVAVLH